MLIARKQLAADQFAHARPDTKETHYRVAVVTSVLRIQNAQATKLAGTACA